LLGPIKWLLRGGKKKAVGAPLHSVIEAWISTPTTPVLFLPVQATSNLNLFKDFAFACARRQVKQVPDRAPWGVVDSVSLDSYPCHMAKNSSNQGIRDWNFWMKKILFLFCGAGLEPTHVFGVTFVVLIWTDLNLHFLSHKRDAKCPPFPHLSSVWRLHVFLPCVVLHNTTQHGSTGFNVLLIYEQFYDLQQLKEFEIWIIQI
jgi:hypothetical protein